MSNYQRVKQSIVSFMALVLMVSVLPVTAFAQGETSNHPEKEVKAVNSDDSDFVASTFDEDKDTPESLGISNLSTSQTSSISSGVYAISKKDTTSYVRCNTIGGGTYLSQQTFSTAPASEAYRYAMFKIIYRSSTDDYVIRNMVNNEIIVYADVGYNAPLSAKMKGINDSAIPSEKTWKITATGDGFYSISCTTGGTTYYMYMPSTGTLELTTNKNLKGAKWSFHQYTGPTFRGWGQIGEWPEHIENGSSATIEAYIYSTVIGENRAWFRDSAVDSDVASASRLSYSAQMTITPKYGGSTKIQIEANTGVTVFGYHYIMSGWDEGCFFIQNKYSSEYLTLLNGASESELRLTGLPSGSDKEYTLWNMVYWSQGYYKIVQDIVGDCVYGNNPVSSNLCGRPWADATWQQILWKFIPQSDGTFKIQSYYHVINNPNNYVSLDNPTTKNIRSMADTGSKQLWIVEPLRFNICVLYDQAFIDRHSSTGHMNVLNNVFSTNSSGTSITSNMLTRLGFHASVTYGSSMNSPYQSYPYSQSCNLLSSANISHICNNTHIDPPYNCSSTGTTNQLVSCQNGYHHKNGNRIINEMLYVSRTSSTNGRILFTGFSCCNIAYGVHTPGAGFTVPGWSTGDGTKSLVMPSDNMRRTAQHELTHILGAHDCGSNNNNNSQNCIIGKNQSADFVIANMELCDTCIGNIKLLKYTFYNH